MIRSRPLFALKAEVAAPQVAEAGPYGTRRFIPVTGGSFAGERLSGRVLPGGADCQLIRPDGVAELDVRVMLEAEAGGQFLLRAFGLRHGPPEVMAAIARGEAVPPDAYYFRESVFFEAADGPLGWLNRLMAVGVGIRNPDSVVLEVHELT